MTMTDDFAPSNVEPVPAYPVVFGIPLTPTISGVLLALLGLGGAAYILLNLVQPEWQKYQELQAQVAEKEAQVKQTEEINKQIEAAQKDLEAAKQQRQSVLSLFADEPVLNTLLLDINRQIDARNAGIDKLRQDKLATCPAWVRNNIRDVEEVVGDLVVRSRLKQFTPDPKLSGVVTDGSYGSLVNNKLKREVINATIEGNFNQTQSILRSIERLQPLLVLKDVEFVVGDGTPGKVATSRLYEIQGNTLRFLANCQPEPKITTTFRLEALLPASQTGAAKANLMVPASAVGKPTGAPAQGRSLVKP
jgi:type IV pilus assembly protein PilO